MDFAEMALFKSSAIIYLTIDANTACTYLSYMYPDDDTETVISQRSI